MKRILIAVVLLGGMAWGQTQVVPDRVLTAKTAVAEVYWPSGAPADVREVKYEAEHFLKKWKRYQVTADVAQADIAIFVMVEPMTVYPGFWQRMAYIQNAQNFGAAQAAPLLEPSTVLTGSILIFDAADLRKWLDAHQPDNLRPQPIMFAEGEGNGNKPLLTAGKHLRKMIDQAAKLQTSISAPSPAK